MAAESQDRSEPSTSQAAIVTEPSTSQRAIIRAFITSGEPQSTENYRFTAENYRLNEFIGSVSIKMSNKRARGRGLYISEPASCGQILLISNALASATCTPSLSYMFVPDKDVGTSTPAPTEPQSSESKKQQSSSTEPQSSESKKQQSSSTEPQSSESKKQRISSTEPQSTESKKQRISSTEPQSSESKKQRIPQEVHEQLASGLSKSINTARKAIQVLTCRAS